MLNLKNSLLIGVSVSAFAMVISPALAQQGNNNETVIVTGTRVQGITAADSAAPITVLGTDALTHGTGSTDLRQQLGSTVPSFQAQQFGGDTANLTLSASLRDLSPNDTLVLVNGKRRHYSGNLHVDGGYGAGSSSADLSLIPTAAIDHVEVLLDGAAAQYGTDAIAGVVNIILKKKSSGGQLSATAGDYYDRGDYSRGKATGAKYDVSFNMGLPLFDKGFVNFTVSKQYEGFTQYGGNDARYVDSNNSPVAQSTVTSINATTGLANLSTVGNAIPNTFLPSVTGYPRANSIDGNPEMQISMGELNAEYDFSDNFSVYAFGTYGHKFGKSEENDRLPNIAIATIGSDQPCSATNPDGYNTGSSAQIGATGFGNTPSCTGPFGLVGSSAPGTGGAGLNSKGIIISSGQAGNLFSTTLINAATGARLPSPTGAGTLSTVPELVLYPSGFSPKEVLMEDDYQYNLGTKFEALGWNIDVDVGYGKDLDYLYTWDTVDRSLFLDSHTSQTRYFNGSFTASQFEGTLDATRNFNVGMASPLTVAWGLEAREDLYGIGVGDPGSNYKEGPVYPGFAPSTAGNHSRKNYALYADFAVAPIEQLQLDIAGRAEHYTDFGDTQIGKITARYDITPQFAVRGTLSTGFRAPNLAEEFYTAVNISPTSATLQLPADSAGAQLLGLQNLKPETSTSYSFGIVAHPLEDLSVTVDAYSIAIGNRITNSATVTSSGGAINSPLAGASVALMGVTLDPTVASQGVTAFLNGVSSVTQGVDATVNYPTDLGDYGLVNWTFVGNYNNTEVGRVVPPPAVLLASNPNATFFSPFSVFAFEHAGPNWTMGLTADWTLDEWGVTLREHYYGPFHAYSSPGNSEEVPTNQADFALTDLEVRYSVTDQLTLAIGADNLFNHTGEVNGAAPNCAALPSNVVIQPGGSCKQGPNMTNGEVQPANGGSVYQTRRTGFYDPNGGYYYGRVTFNF